MLDDTKVRADSWLNAQREAVARMKAKIDLALHVHSEKVFKLRKDRQHSMQETNGVLTLAPEFRMRQVELEVERNELQVCVSVLRRVNLRLELAEERFAKC